MAEKQWSVCSSDVTETRHLASQLAGCLRGGEVIILKGDLGAGKTSFTQGLAKGMGINRTVNSPTFTIIKEYEGARFALYHMDAYRLEDETEALGLEEYFDASGVCVIEWPEKIESQLPAERLEIVIRKKRNDERLIQFHPVGEKYMHILQQFFEGIGSKR